MMAEARGMAADAASKIDPGEQSVTVNLTVTFDLE
jgi:uncharacterized protein YggE